MILKIYKMQVEKISYLQYWSSKQETNESKFQYTNYQTSYQFYYFKLFITNW